jgi:uncharacterized hydrophobic protein (TIGR00271 family)
MDRDRIQKFRFFIKLFRFWKSLRDKFAASLDVNFDRKVELYVDLTKSATLRDIVYWLQILFSAGIATLGLVLNSSAVIIGAMLISPLMGPILSAGLALATGDLILAFRATANLMLSTIGAIIFAVILVNFLPFNDLTPEIMARTKPNTLDLVIALFSGAIGSIATCRQVKGVVTSIPGVAIAVALMPPLCVVGYGTGLAVVNFSEGMKIAAGGGLLYLTNLVAITFTSMLVFVLLRIDTSKVREKVQLWRETDREHLFWRNLIAKVPQLEKAREIRSFSLRFLMIMLPLLIIFIPLSQSLGEMRNEIETRQRKNSLVKEIRSVWKKIEDPNDKDARSEIDDLRVTENKDLLQVYLRVFLYKTPYTQEDRENFINRLSERLNVKEDNISFQLVEVPLSEKKTQSPVIQATPTPQTVAQAQTKYLEKIRSNLSGFELSSPALLIDYDVIIKSNNQVEIAIKYLSSRDIEDDAKELLAKDVQRLLNLQNLALSYTRFSSEITKLVFVTNKAEFSSDETQKLEKVIKNLIDHPKLKLRVTLKTNGPDKQLFEKRTALIKELFIEKSSLSEDRLVISETKESKEENTYQYFIDE